jgi:hypothetical protein
MKTHRQAWQLKRGESIEMPKKDELKTGLEGRRGERPSIVSEALAKSP